MRRLHIMIAGLISLAWLGGAEAAAVKPNYEVQADAINAAGGASASAD